MGLQAKTTSPQPRKPKMAPAGQRHPREEKNQEKGSAEADCWKDFGIADFFF